MRKPEPDRRSAKRRELDERIAAEPELPPPKLHPDAVPRPLETYLEKRSPRPLAVAGVVEKGVVRPLDPLVRLPEHSRVIIVAAEG